MAGDEFQKISMSHEGLIILQRAAIRTCPSEYQCPKHSYIARSKAL